MNTRAIDLTGLRFGTWTVVEFAGRSSGKAKIALWKCRCDCGAESVVYGTALRAGKSTCCTSCAVDKISKPRTSHGLSHNSPTYLSWKSMKSRCTNESSPDYPLYGGRGVRVCERWNQFENFVSDMGLRPANTSLDRRDSDGDYCPENCRWATSTEQANNRRNNHVINFNGVDMTISQFAKEIGMDRRMARYWLVVKELEPDVVAKSKGMATVGGATERSF